MNKVMVRLSAPAIINLNSLLPAAPGFQGVPDLRLNGACAQLIPLCLYGPLRYYILLSAANQK